MTLVLLLGYIPFTLLLIGLGLLVSSRANDSESAHVLGDQLGRRSGLDRRSNADMAFVGADRRTGQDRRGAVAASERRDRAA